MAYNAQQIPPIDLWPGRAVGVTLPFNGPACFNSSYTTSQAIKANLINWFLTNQGERPLNPNFGGNLRKYIFEQITQGTLDSVKEDIQSQIARVFPNVAIQSINVLSQPDYLAVTVQIYYIVLNTTISGELTLNL